MKSRAEFGMPKANEYPFSYRKGSEHKEVSHESKTNGIVKIHWASCIKFYITSELY